MSYGIYIGKSHTATGIPYLAGYGDEPSSHWLTIAPAQSFDADATIPVGVTPQAEMPGRLTRIPQARNTARNMRVEYSYYLGVPAPLTNGGLNEHGVAVRDIWSTSSDALIALTPKDQTGPNYSDLARIVVERARSAREGVDLIGALIAEHGYSTYGGNSHLIADPDEAWVVIEFAGGLGLWMAERLGAGSIRASRPGFIGEIPGAPNADFLYPAHFIQIACDRGWYDPATGPFNVNRVYGDGKGRWDGVIWIEEEMQRRAEQPGKITLKDVFWSISTSRLTGDTAGYGQVVPLEHPAHPDLRMMYHAPVGPITAPLLPVWLGQNAVPDAYTRHRYLSTGESARFLDRRKEAKIPDAVSTVPQGIESGDSAVFSFKQLMHLAFQKQDTILPETDAHWRNLEACIEDALPAVKRSAEVLVEAGETELAAILLTDFSAKWFDRALADCKVLAAAAHARLRAAGELNMTPKPLSPPQCW